MTRRLKCRIDPERSPYTGVLPEHKPVRRGREMIGLLEVEEPKPKPAKIRAVPYEAAIDQLFKRMRSSSYFPAQKSVFRGDRRRVATRGPAGGPTGRDVWFCGFRRSREEYPSFAVKTPWYRGQDTGSSATKISGILVTILPGARGGELKKCHQRGAAWHPAV